MTARRVEDDHQEEGGRKMAARRRMEDDRQKGWKRAMRSERTCRH